MKNKAKQFLREFEATYFEILILKGRRAHTRRRLLYTPHPPLPRPKIKKIASFVGPNIANVLRDLPFSQNQPLKSADG
jgi:hypothetical protein